MRSLIWGLIKWFLFRIDAETAHRFTLSLIQLGLRMKGLPLRVMSGASWSQTKALADARGSTPLEIAGLSFPSRVGLAAGFDKDAEILNALPHLGFGFAEIGTVTPRPQAGNERPRLFRDPARQSLFNRMGFNGLGAEIVSANLKEARESLPSGFRVGVNVGKNKDTSLEDAASDYLKATRAFEGLADYIVINVSSPNTPGLRSLQTLEALEPIIREVKTLIAGWRVPPPLFLKLAPELFASAASAAASQPKDELSSLFQTSEQWGIDGWVLTNTLGGTLSAQGLKEPLSGGWSGGVLREHSYESLRVARGLTARPIISVGGILSAEEAKRRVDAGADLVQLYSGWIFAGPAFPAEVARALK